MRICLLTYRGNPFCGGQGVYVDALSRELVRQGHTVHVVSGPPYPPRVPGVTLHRLPALALHLGDGRADDGNDGNQGGAGSNGTGAPGPLGQLAPIALYERAAFLAGIFPEMTAFSLRAFYKVRGLQRRERFDVIHDNQSLGWGLLPMGRLGVPVIATIHHPLTVDRRRGFEPPTSFRQQLSRLLFYPIPMQGHVARRLKRIVTVSHASAEAIAADFRVAPGRIRVIHNGVDTARFRPPSNGSRVAGRVIYVGNLEDRNKGVVYLLRAMALVRRPAHLLVVGSGGTVPQWVRREIAGLGIEARVRFEAQLPPGALVERYGTAEAAVSPSLFEGFGFPAAEAMACGLPLVAARGGALPEVVGDAGLLVPTRDPAAIARALDTLLGDGELRARLGRAARSRMVEKFRWERAARELVQVYEEVRDAHR